MSCLPHLGQISFLPTGPSASLSPTGSPISRAKLSNASSAAPVCPLTANSARCLSTASRARALSRTSSGCSRAARIAPARAFASSVRRFAALRPPKAPISAALSEVCSRETILPVSGSFVILKPRSSISPPHSIRTPNRSPCLSFFDIADQRQVKLLGQPAHDLIPLIYNHPPSASRLHIPVHRRLVSRNQLMLAGTDEIGAAHAPQRGVQHRPVVGVVVTQEGLVQPALLQTLGDVHRLAAPAHLAQRILAGVVHGGRGRHRARQERLHLIGAKTVLLQPQGEVEHVLVGRARVRGAGIGNP